MSRTVARETTMKLLYQIDISGSSPEETLRVFYENREDNEIGSEDRDYIENSLKGTISSLKKIDEYIEKYSKEWKVNRIAKVDLAIMRLAIYEMINRDDVPNSVAINEAIELAKKFGGENSSIFINGIIGNIIRELN